MNELPLDKQISIAVNEIIDKRRACSIWFSIIAISIFLAGLYWPKTYESSTTLLRDQTDVVRPLLEGTAVSSSGSLQSEFAKELIHSNKTLETVIDAAGINVDATGRLLDDRELEVLKAHLRKKILVDRDGENILKISYTSSNPEEAFLVVNNASKLFIAETTQKKKSGSNEAYVFIDNQVSEYKNKLDEINRRINEFKAKNVEIQVDTSEGVNSRISELNDSIRRTSLELEEASIQKASLIEQMIIESQSTTAEEVVNIQQQRLAEMESSLNTLRLSYTETYPDIVQLKEQIKALRESIINSTDSSPDSRNETEGSSRGGARSELYQRLKRQIADQETLIKTLEARKLDQERRFDQQIARSSTVNKLVSKLEELSRDREVTNQLYNQLLTRRENARVSLSLEMENNGSLFKIQEPPLVPLIPKGLRFLHFAIGSFVLGAGIPIGFIVAFLFVDPRIRHEEGLQLGDDIPVFGSIKTLRTAPELSHEKWVTAQAVALLVLTFVASVTLALSRYYEVI